MSRNLPEKLTPIPELDRSRLPEWIEDVGAFEGFFVMKTHSKSGAILHCSGLLANVDFDEGFWVRFAEPMVNSIGGMLFEDEWPGMSDQSVRWEVEAAMNGRELNGLESRIIARRKELTWKASASTD